MTCPRARKVGCRLPPPNKGTLTTTTPIPSTVPSRCPRGGSQSVPQSLALGSSRSPWVTPSSPPPPPPRASSYLLGDAGRGPPGSAGPGGGGVGEPHEQRDGAGSSREEKRTAQTLPGEGGGGASAHCGRPAARAPREHPLAGSMATVLPGGGYPRALPPPPPGGALTPTPTTPPNQRSPLWSGAGPFRVSSDISRDGIQGDEPRG